MSGTNGSRRRAPDWVAIRRLYEESGTTVRAIAATHGTTPSAIQKRRLAQGWPKRSERSGAKITVGCGKSDGQSGRRALISRLLQAVDRNLELMEMRMDSDEPATAADRERDTRAIGALTRTLGKITELQSETDPARGAAPNSGSAIDLDDAEADRLRLEIAERILRLGERRQPL
ncbi:MAG: hypothetical protein KJZ80_09460 [Hyphomicrobiaceae bacterium]|nr:hypothetical protein [Hyphomicrobiaceae bacterium]